MTSLQTRWSPAALTKIAVVITFVICNSVAWGTEPSWMELSEASPNGKHSYVPLFGNKSSTTLGYDQSMRPEVIHCSGFEVDEDQVPPTALNFSYVGDACSSTTNYQLDSEGNAQFSCEPNPGVALAGLASVSIINDADKVSAEAIGNTVRIFRSDVLGEWLPANIQYTLTDRNGEQQTQILHTSNFALLAVGDQFGAWVLIQKINGICAL